MSTMYRLVAVAGLIAAGSLLGTTVGAQATDHCPDHHGHPGKVENVNSPSHDFAEGTVFCVKAGTFATGIIDDWGGGTYTTPAEWHPLGKEPIDISYYVIYSVTDPGNGNGDDPGNGTDPDNGDDPGNGTDPDNGDNGTEPGNGDLPVDETPEPDTEQLPPPGTDEPATVPPRTAPVEAPSAPDAGTDPPVTPTDAAPELTALPETGAAVVVTAALGLTMLALGVGLRRLVR
jgi:hypothetical protein